MKNILALAVASAVSLALAGTAAAAHDPRVPSLQRQVGALQGQMAQIQKAVLYDEHLSDCRWVTQLDIDIDVENVFLALAGEPPYSGSTPSDGGACAAVGMPTPSPTRALAGVDPLGQLGKQLGRAIAW